MVQRFLYGLALRLRQGFALSILTGTLGYYQAFSQTPLPLTDLSAFRSPAKSWKIAGNVGANLDKANHLSVDAGTGVLANVPDKKNKGQDLLTTFEHGDIDLELDYMMAPGSNSGIYLQGLYELQLEDSWGDRVASPANNGGVYERWDESRPEGKKGYEGYAPRQNVSKAPGLWQHLKLSFQAPRFDASGKKTENAKFLRVELNGVLIHEDLELMGPTRGALKADESATGPLRFQGDHGPVAFRNIVVTHYDKPRPEISNLTYQVYKGKFEGETQYDSLPPEAEGNAVILTSNLNPLPKQFLIRYRGTLKIQEPGEYRFNLNVPGGGGYLKIGDDYAIKLTGSNGKGSVSLPAGEMPFELVYSKYIDWVDPALGLNVAGPGVRDYIISDEISSRGEVVDPILVNATENTILRSFMDIPKRAKADNGQQEEGGHRVTHSINVGTTEQVHYTYDLDNGSLIQIWRGGFLDTTPMWHERGDGSSRPQGAIQQIAPPVLSVAKLTSGDAAWATDTTGSGYRPKGYVLNANGLPTFRYIAWGTAVEDAITPLANGQGFRRELQVQNPADGLYLRLASGSTIETLDKGKYVVDGKAYYLQLEDAKAIKPVVRNTANGQELIVPLRNKLAYSIIF